MLRKQETDSRLPEECSLQQLCRGVMEMHFVFEEVKDFIEKQAYAECKAGKLDASITALEDVAAFFEAIENKNEEVTQDLAEVYLLIGELCQSFDRIAQSIQWFRKAIIVDDRYPLPYEELASSYFKLGQIDKAIRSLEQEIRLAPGNYFAYLEAAELYDQAGRVDKAEECITRLLDRDPDNITALHRLICLHLKHNRSVNVSFLRRRIANIHKPMQRGELLIWSYHMFKLGKIEGIMKVADALNDISLRQIGYAVKSYIHLAMNERPKFIPAAQALLDTCTGRRQNYLDSLIMEFGAVFGNDARLHLAYELKNLP
ncbi:MAG: tetratricopeptide repeat protein [Chitinivibrionales bacterium]|nr:tetratricopeptide repeat protein [Chitinivibrionales bacterium]